VSAPKDIGWGILGCGHIAGKFANDLSLAPGSHLVASYGRDLSKAEEFSACFGGTAHADLGQFLSNPGIDAVYVASPHALHPEHVRACLDAGIPVLCEKPFALSRQDAEPLLELAQAKGVFLMEALWTRFLPHFCKTLELLQSGAVGTPQLLMADFGFVATKDPASRLNDPSLGGGALWDIGIYPLFLALEYLGVPEIVKAQATLGPTGVDLRLSMSLSYPGGAMAHLIASFLESTPGEARLYGSAGNLLLERMFHTPTDLVVFDAQGKGQRISTPREGHGYQHEILHMNQCLRQGLVQSPLWPHSKTLELLALMERVQEATAQRPAL